MNYLTTVILSLILATLCLLSYAWWKLKVKDFVEKEQREEKFKNLTERQEQANIDYINNQLGLINNDMDLW